MTVEVVAQITGPAALIGVVGAIWRLAQTVKTVDQHERSIERIARHLDEIRSNTADTAERVARIEGRLNGRIGP